MDSCFDLTPFFWSTGPPSKWIGVVSLLLVLIWSAFVGFDIDNGSCVLPEEPAKAASLDASFKKIGRGSGPYFSSVSSITLSKSESSKNTEYDIQVIRSTD